MGNFQVGIIDRKPIFLRINKLKVLSAYRIFSGIYPHGKLSAFKRCATKCAFFIINAGCE